MTQVEIVPAETILPTDLPGDDPEAERQYAEMLEWLQEEPEEAPTIEVEAVTVE